jgi:hypothetical protein
MGNYMSEVKHQKPDAVGDTLDIVAALIQVWLAREYQTDVRTCMARDSGVR